MSSSCTCAPRSTTASAATRSRKCCCNARSTAAFRRRMPRSTWRKKYSRRWMRKLREAGPITVHRELVEASPELGRKGRTGNAPNGSRSAAGSVVVLEEDAMKCRKWVERLLLAAALVAFATAAPAQNVVKLGMVGEFSGPFAQHGQQILAPA